MTASHQDKDIASQMLQEHLLQIEAWLQKWRIKANESKSIHVTFSNRKGNCPAVTLNDYQLPHKSEAKYLGMFLDRRLTWQKHPL